MSQTVFSSCNSWYRNGKGGKVVAIYPGPLTELWWKAFSVKWDDYVLKGVKKVWWKTRTSLALMVATLGVLAVGSQGKTGRRLKKELLIWSLMRYQDVLTLLGR